MHAIDIHIYRVVIDRDTLALYGSEVVAEHRVPNYGESIEEAWNVSLAKGTARMGWIDYGEFEVIMPYDSEDGFGYAWNITDEAMSEYGSVGDLPTGNESIAEFEARQAGWLGSMRLMGDFFIEVGPKAVQRRVSTPLHSGGLTASNPRPNLGIGPNGNG